VSLVPRSATALCFLKIIFADTCKKNASVNESIVINDPGYDALQNAIKSFLKFAKCNTAVVPTFGPRTDALALRSNIGETSKTGSAGRFGRRIARGIHHIDNRSE
jgi:hypothetical protein